MMNRTLGFEFVVYGVLLSGLGFLTGVGMLVMLVFSFSLLMNLLHGQGRLYGAEG